MSFPKINDAGRPRELRRRVLLPARLRTGAQWSDTCILNISSRGLMIQSGRSGPEGSTVELRRGDHAIIAQVVWREGGRAGLRTDERLPVEEIMSLSNSGALTLVACDGARVDRRRHPRHPPTDARLQGRAIEFVSVAAIAISLALGAWAAAEQALAAPMAKVESALAG
jgi:PilZ domain